MLSMLSERGRELQVYNGEKFYKSDFTKRGQKWRCVKKRCRAVLFTNEIDDIIQVGEHNHNKCETIHRNYVSNMIKRQDSEILERPAKLLVHMEIGSAVSEIESPLTKTDVNYVRKNVKNARKKLYAPLLKNVSEAHSTLDSNKVSSEHSSNIGPPTFSK